MKKNELVYAYLLEKAIERKSKIMTQAEIAKALGISLSTVNNAINPLRRMCAVRIKLRSLEVINPKKILYYWASIRNIEKDIIYKTRVNASVSEIEKNMPADVVYGSYSAYKFLFNDVPADYSEVYAYSNDLTEIKKRFAENRNTPNLFVLKKDINNMAIANIFVDLWNLKEWYAKDFLSALEAKIDGILAWATNKKKLGNPAFS